MERGLRIALADDDEGVRGYLTRCLADLGHEVTAVEDGKALVELCWSICPDLVVSDVQMPQMDGLAAATIIRKEFAIPVILMSGCWSRAQAEAAAMLDIPCLEKPVRPLTLVSVIDEAFRGYHRQPARLLGQAPAVVVPTLR